MNTIAQPNAPWGITTGVPIEGHIEFFGHCVAAGGGVFCGWCPDLWPNRQGSVKVFLRFQRSSSIADAVLCFYPRPDLPPTCVGLILFVPSFPKTPGELISIDVQGEESDRGVRILPLRPIVQLREADIVSRVSSLLQSGFGNSSSIERLGALMARKGFSGQDTLGSLSSPVLYEADCIIRLPGLGILLIGWLVDVEARVAHLRIRCGAHGGEISPDRTITLPRLDVIEAVGTRFGYDNANCGCIWLVPMEEDVDQAFYLEVEMIDQSIAHKPLPAPSLKGIAAIRHLLEHVRVDTLKLDTMFGNVLVPAVSALNRARLDIERAFEILNFGELPEKPICSIIIPLYGRIDFLEYQMAAFSVDTTASMEFIYVLDDPRLREDLLRLAYSVHARFSIPFRIIFLKKNLGYAPANNVGLSIASGEYICFLNSDVIPETIGWIHRMISHLERNPSVGIVGALLLFEDGTVQHAGMAFEQLEELGNWPFPYHPGKGRLSTTDQAGLRVVDAVTGACMVLSASVAHEMGGFDEAYAIGDFEDSDLCLRVRNRHLSCVVDESIRLWHLERQSQSESKNHWRFNLTLVNCFIHKSRWLGNLGIPGSPR